MTSYSERDYEIFTPMGNSRADFIAVKGTELIRVQVKTAQTRYYKEKNTKYTLGVLTTTRNGQATPYTPEEIDAFFVLGDSMAWEIPNHQVYPKKTVMLESTVTNYTPRHGFAVDSWRVPLSG